MSDERPSRGRSWLRRPVGRTLLAVAIVAGGLWLWGQQRPHATIAIVNQSDQPLTDVLLVLEEPGGNTLVEELAALGPGSRWEHRSPAALLDLESLTFLHAGQAQRYDDLGGVEAGQIVTLTITPEGGLDRQEVYLSR